MTLQLSGQQKGQLHAALFEALNVLEFTKLVSFRLGKNPNQFLPVNGTLEQAIYDLVDRANGEGWISNLLIKAREATPGNPKLYAVAQEAGLVSSSTQKLTEAFESTIKIQNNQLDVAVWRSRLGEIEFTVCRIEILLQQGGTAYGTGFLIGPDLVITNYHVIEPVDLGEQGKTTMKGYSAKATNLVCRFDYKWVSGSEVSAGSKHHLAHNWKVFLSHSCPLGQLPPTDKLDFAIIRLNSNVGNQVINASQDAGGAKRGWLTPRTPYTFIRGTPLFIMQHPAGGPLKLTLDTDSTIGENENGTRVTYTTNTENGSSGSPCLTEDLEVVALHHSGDPHYDQADKPIYNEGIPFAPIATLLQQNGLNIFK